MGKLNSLPKDTQLIKTQRSLFQPREEMVGMIKSHGTEILSKMVKYVCQILMKLEKFFDKKS